MKTTILHAHLGASAIARAFASTSMRVSRVALAMTNRSQRNAVGATYSLANSQGEKIALVSIAQQGLGSTRRAATRMALSGDLTSALRAASQDYESSGAVSPETMSRMRQLLGEVDA
jgi:tartrate dehydratase alpha subunit/fumarate hydratase class I-like protein